MQRTASIFMRKFAWFALIGLLPLGACGSEDSSNDGSGGSGANAGNGGTSGNGGGISGEGLKVRGKITTSRTGGGASPVDDAEVTAGIDLDGDGKLSENELVRVNSNSDGEYEIEVSVSPGDHVVLSYRSPGLAPHFRRVIASHVGQAVLNISMAELKELSCVGSSCLLEGNQLRIEGLPEGASGYAKIFNPVAQPDSFPGAFEEDQGKPLLSGVFSSVELTDDNGNPLRQLTSPATLHMAIPIDTWGIIVDIEKGNDRIEVPLYAFDENIGTWVRDGQAHLEDANGNIIPESALPSIRDGSYNGTVVSVGEVSHFSYWNVDWPVESNGCMTGTVLDANGNPAVGATVTVRATTYVGSSSPQTVDENGTFCVSVIRSENPGEDLNQNGVTGETHNLVIRAHYQDEVYDLGAFDVGTQQATCSEGGCTDIGDHRLTSDKRLQVALCSVTGKVKDIRGNPIAKTLLFANDDTLESAIAASVCGEYYENCTLFSESQEDGSFSLTMAMLESLNIIALYSTEKAVGHTVMRFSERFFSSCPTQPVTITLDQGYDYYELKLSLSGNEISWTPAMPLLMLSVSDSEAMSKWSVGSEDGGSSIPGPVTYGVVPNHARQNYPLDGLAPAPLTSGDTITIVATSTTDDGYPLTGYATYTLP